MADGSPQHTALRTCYEAFERADKIYLHSSWLSEAPPKNRPAAHVYTTPSTSPSHTPSASHTPLSARPSQSLSPILHHILPPALLINSYPHTPPTIIRTSSLISPPLPPSSASPPPLRAKRGVAAWLASSPTAERRHALPRPPLAPGDLTCPPTSPRRYALSRCRQSCKERTNVGRGGRGEGGREE